MVSGYGPTAGAALASHMDVDKVFWEPSLLDSFIALEFCNESRMNLS